MPLFSAFVLGLLSILLQRLAKKYHLDFLVQNQQLIDGWALKGISYAEEQAAKAMKNSQTLKGEDKLRLAVAYVIDKMPAVSEDEAKRIIESLLAQIPGLGATKATTVVSPL
jgi:hypothetical protein